MAYDSLKLEKGMYRNNKSFTEVLESLDPSANYDNTALAGLDAYERQLKRFGIKVSGTDSSAVEKFFSTSDSAALFPEYISRAVRQGAQERNLLSSVIAAKTKVNGLDYRTIASIPSGEDLELKSVAEGAVIPETVITTQENLVKLNKHGRMLVASYEAIRFQHLDVFTVMLRQIGAHIASSQLKDAVDVIINGDGNSNAASVINTVGTNTLTYDDLIALWGKFDPYELNTMLVSPQVMMKMLAIPEFKDPATGLNFQATGKLTSPLGADIVKSSGVPQNTVIGLDRKYGLEMIVAQDVALDSDRVIDRQLERVTISSIAGFAKICNDASNVLKIKTA